MLGPEIAFCMALLTKVGVSVHGAAVTGTGMLGGHAAHLSSGHASSPGSPNWGAELMTFYGLANEPQVWLSPEEQ